MNLGFKALAGTPAGAVPACRYTSAVGLLVGVGDFECGFLSRARATRIRDLPFSLVAPGADGSCPAGLLEVDRAWAPRASRLDPAPPRGRLTTSASVLRDLAGAGWSLQGPVGCSRP